MKNIVIVFLLLLATIALPFALRPKKANNPSLDAQAERLIIISPHNESIRSEFAIAFTQHMRENHDREVFIDWRQPGGTSEIAKFLRSEYTNAFENYWTEKTGLSFSLPVREGFGNGKVEANPASVEPLMERLQKGEKLDPDELTRLSRGLFLDSDIGVGMDLFFGGGAYDFSRQASAGTLVASDASGNFGPRALAREHPDWFSDQVMPAVVSGEPFRDPEFRWLGTVLSAFGIIYNRDGIERLGIDPPSQWQDLANPKFSGQIALADPTKSGSATKAFEMLIQQKMQQIYRASQMQARPIEDIERDAIRSGWDEAMRMIVKISANGRYFTDSSSKVPHDVAQGEAAAGMCIDFYGRTYNEKMKNDDGYSRVEFVMPRAGTSIGADPIGMLRGAPHPELAHRFIEFVLSTEGQKIWNYRLGTPGGPVRSALRRPPIRKDFYTAENQQYMSDNDVNPYELSRGFTYREAWTAPLFSALRFVIRCICVDIHVEQRKAWQALIEADFPPGALAEFENVSAINYDRVKTEISKTLKSKNKIEEVALARTLSGEFRERYRKVIDLCGDE